MNFTWWVSDYLQNERYVELASVVFWMLFSITLHELAHGWAALRQGDDTPARLGHMTANPLVHMPAQSLIMFALCGIAWGRMPVTPQRFRRGRRSAMLVSAAGPAMNLLIAAVCLGVITAWMALVPKELPLYANGTTFLYRGLALNLVLAPFNLIPIPPLDGADILARYSYRVRTLYDHPEASIVGMLLFLALFNMSPIGGIFTGEIYRGANKLVDATGSLVGNPTLYEVLVKPEVDAQVWKLLQEAEREGVPPPPEPAPPDAPSAPGGP